jgi:LPS export ABC transporter protein LptC/lipopolysaccharide transport protein LptA
MKKWPGILFAIFMVILFLEIFLGFPIRLESEPEPAPMNANKIFGPEEAPVKNQKQTEQKMQGVHLVESRSGERDWELFADAAENTQGKGSWKLEKVRVQFYNKEKPDFTVVGEKGRLDSANKNMQIEGNVVVTSPNGYVFQSELVNYSSATRTIRSPNSVRMKAPGDTKGSGMTLTGNSFIAQVEDSLMTIQENVKATKPMSDEKSFQIKSGSAQFSGKNRTAQFFKDVSIDVGPLKMEGPEATFEYGAGINILQSVRVKGGVKVSDLDKYATSDSVQFDPEQNKFTFNGRPRVVQNNDEITGDQIVFIDGGKKVRVEKTRVQVEKK